MLVATERMREVARARGTANCQIVSSSAALRRVDTISY